ncbi:MAG: diacylglycerol kinase family lipid kinase, partial [Treponema sp.]|nr:diacylglycerol kinase family lipid kinase [Treponema sp.]
VYYFIVNERGGSGKARKTWQKVKKLLDEKNITYSVLTTSLETTATILARNVSSLDGEVNLVVVGGDGTVNEVLNGIGDFEKVRLGVIPTGSGNDFARGLGLPKNSVKALNKILDCDAPKKIDLGKVILDDGNHRLFGISSGLGMDAIVCKKALSSKLKDALNKVGLGKFIYVIYTIQTLFTMQTATYSMAFDDGSTVELPGTIFSAFMNFPAEGGGVKMSPEALADDGKISLCSAYGIKKIKTFFDFPFLIAGKHGKLKGFLQKDSSTFDIKTSAPQTLHIDGEYGGEVTHVRIETVAKKLSVLV